MYHKVYRAGQNLVESFFGSLDLNVKNVKAGIMNSIGAMGEAKVEASAERQPKRPVVSGRGL